MTLHGSPQGTCGKQAFCIQAVAIILTRLFQEENKMCLSLSKRTQAIVKELRLQASGPNSLALRTIMPRLPSLNRVIADDRICPLWIESCRTVRRIDRTEPPSRLHTALR